MKILEEKYYPDGWVYWNRYVQEPFCPICIKELNKATKLEKGVNNTEELHWYCKIHDMHFSSMNSENPFT